ncbi:MAG: TolC family protein, partial [Pirellulaceae bacterium]
MRSLAFNVLVFLAVAMPSASWAQQSDTGGDEDLRRAFEEIYQSDWMGNNAAAAPDPVIIEAERVAEQPEIDLTVSGPISEEADSTGLGVYSQPLAFSSEPDESMPFQVEEAPVAATNEQAVAGPLEVDMASPKMWWHPLVLQPLGDRPTEAIGADAMVQLALQNSPRILAISQTPLIEETEISVANAEFDPYLFLRSQFDDRVDPVGNDLTTGPGIPFLKDHIWGSDAGIRRKLHTGGEIELQQTLGFQNSNSRFFNPQDQGTATLSLNFSQPLLRGGGKCFNRSQIMIAQIGHGVAWDQFAADLQSELTKIVEAYWTLYYNRAVLLQKQYNVERGQVVLQKLEGRSELDSLPSQIARARAAVQSRLTELANAQRDVRNAETNIRRLIGSQETFHAMASELIPMESPGLFRMNSELEFVIQEAMQMRPEVQQAIKRAKIAAVQQDISENELLPELNLIFDTYVAALRGESEITAAWVDQFRNSTPGYAVGLEFALPYGRRAAKARNSRQQLLLRQVRHEIDQTVFDVVAEAQIAWRQVDSA